MTPNKGRWGLLQRQSINNFKFKLTSPTVLATRSQAVFIFSVNSLILFKVVRLSLNSPCIRLTPFAWQHLPSLISSKRWSGITPPTSLNRYTLHFLAYIDLTFPRDHNTSLPRPVYLHFPDLSLVWETVVEEEILILLVSTIQLEGSRGGLDCCDPF